MSRDKYIEKNLPANIRVLVRHHKGCDGRLLWTSCQLVDTDKDSYVVAHGEAYVSKNERCPSKKIGRAVAVGRAIKMFREGARKLDRLSAIQPADEDTSMLLGPAFTSEPFTTPRGK